jgi:hypothetical protein
LIAEEIKLNECDNEDKASKEDQAIRQREIGNLEQENREL